MRGTSGAMSSPTAILAPSVSRPRLWRVFFRSLLLQAAWNPKGMQNLGFAYALYPALEALYPDPGALNAAAERHLKTFNCHPYAAAAILGGAVHHEEAVARGEESPDAVEAFKQSLMGPLAALGDGFFWLSLRPACGALAALWALGFADLGNSSSAALWSLAVFLVGYNGVHLALRARFFWAGRALGDGVVGVIAAAKLPHYGGRLRELAAAAAGALVGWTGVGVPRDLGLPLWTALGGWAVFAAAWGLLGRGFSAYTVAYAAAAVALAGGLIF